MPENTDSRGGVVNCPALLLSESLRAQLKVYGLSLASGTTVCGEVAFESPVSVFSGSHVAFSSLGAYSYVSFGSKLVHASVGRYTSIAHQVEVGLSQHDIRAVSTSAALINAGVFDFCSGHVERLPLRLRQVHNPISLCLISQSLVLISFSDCRFFSPLPVSRFPLSSVAHRPYRTKYSHCP